MNVHGFGFPFGHGLRLGHGFGPPGKAGHPAAPEAVPEDRSPRRAGRSAAWRERTASDAPHGARTEPRCSAPDSKPPVQVQSLDAADYRHMRLRRQEASLEVSFELELRTVEGDRVLLRFEQLDVASSTGLTVRGGDGGRLAVRVEDQRTERLVHMEVTGDLSDSERSALDAVLAEVVEAANGFFRGGGGDGMARLEELSFDSSALADLSLQMSMSSHVEVLRAYGCGSTEGDGLERLAERNSEVTRSLALVADAQRRVVSAASEVLSEASAVKMVRGVLPPLLQSAAAA